MDMRVFKVVQLTLAWALLSGHDAVMATEPEVKPAFLRGTQPSAHHQSSTDASNTLLSSTTGLMTTTLLRTTAEQEQTATQIANHQLVTTASALNTMTDGRANVTQLTNQATHAILTRDKNTTAMANQTESHAVSVTAASKITLKTTPKSTNLTTTHKTTKTTATTKKTTVHPRTQVTTPATTAATTAVPPTFAPQPSTPQTGNYSVTDGEMTCVLAVMGLGLIVHDTVKRNVGYFNIDPNMTQISGTCVMEESVITISFNGGTIRFTFLKKDPEYYVSELEANLEIPNEGSWKKIIRKPMFTTKLGDSFKCLSKQTVDLENHFQLIIVNMQLQAFKIVGNTFGKEEECPLDRNKNTVPVIVALSILAIVLIVLITILIARRKINRGYERI
ncbi:lysosome-associated membrane glycoprotein 3 [Alligator mississippiensis]|uniref:lysosome-associated membrane glycoprotein 3 n=1 Tax=Alligator mississippiensis TaxID=8496 RepID=UPI00071219AB|nr:lysosome-associated membrane glycoprotein 3 [Alligator mississippiensis]XP_019333991.1 lysosome-associated membrane glycoprotein 3 [Alligator mississippiensis]XP_019333992.1 lysosome-associated membrane glycoprotein 3 [Alligator mississippiensis]